MAIITTILPVFLLIALGWITIHNKLIDAQGLTACKTLVTHYVFPALLFMETAYTAPGEIIEPRWIAAFFIAMAIIWALSFFANKWFFKKDVKSSAILAMLCAFPNMGGMGIPFLLQLIGAAAIISVARANFVISLTLIPLTIVLLSFDANAKNSLIATIGAAMWLALKKPLFLAVFRHSKDPSFLITLR